MAPRHDIYCYSAMGNSAWVASELDRLLPEGFDDPVWVFPVHSWGVPLHVIEELEHTDFCGQRVHMVCTCGSETGNIDLQWRELLAKSNGVAGGIYSVVMPNTYVCFPFMDVDSAKVRDGKLEAARERVADIARRIAERCDDVDLKRGPMPGFTSGTIYPFFFNKLMKWRKFHHTHACTGCGKCASLCPEANITMVEGEPHWGSKCVYCLRCYHVCPSHAVAYGHQTGHKGQYLHPDFQRVIKFCQK